MTCSAFVALVEDASVTLAVKLNVPGAVGVPESTPPVDKLNPPGKDPALTVQVYGVVPPPATSVTE